MKDEGKSTDYQDLTFRDRVPTVDNEGKRVWVFPKMPKGKFYNYRRLVAYSLLFLFFLLPHIKLSGEPLILLNFTDRNFVLFGNSFYPHDFHILALSFITLLVFIILFTAIYGRIFCGWICPQTVFMEFLYRPIEYLIDGDRSKQKRLSAQEMTPNKLFKRLLKHSLFFMISFFTVVTFLSYIISFENVTALLQGWSTTNSLSLLGVLIFSSIHYFIYAWFREQVCSLVCPYGRLQGVMLDQNSIVVAYDYIRGEPRGFGKNDDNGDCIDCKKCVDVCPTGIDIRNGTQLDCINCTACIDACNSIMFAINKPKGLVRYASERSISEGKKQILNARSIAYSIVLVILLGIVSYAFSIRGEVETTIIRAQGTMFQEYGNNAYSNLYDLQMINKSKVQATLALKLLEPEGEIKIIGSPLVIMQGEVIKRNLLIILEKSILRSSNTHIEIGIYHEEELVDKISSTFVGPNALDKLSNK